MTFGVSDRMLEKMAKSRILKPEIALLYFASKGDIVEARAALRLGADKDTTDYDGYTPLQRCVRFAPRPKVGPMMKLLLKVGADERLHGGVLKDVPEPLPVVMSIMKSVTVWRAKASFSMVSKAFLEVKMAMDDSKRSLRRRKKSRKHLYWTPSYDSSRVDSTFLENNADILKEVLTFVT